MTSFARPMTAEESVLRTLALKGSERRARKSQLATSLGQVEVSRLLTVMGRQRLLPLFGTRLEELLPDSVPNALRQARDEEIRSRREAAGVLLMVGEHIAGELAASGIKSAPLKGAPAALELYGDLGLRATGDIDLLVTPQDLHGAVDVLKRLGWTAPLDPVDRRGRPRLHFAMGNPQGLPQVELHWRVHWYEEQFATEALGRASGQDFQVGDRLVMLLLQVARDGLAGLRLAVDAITWEDRHPEAIDVAATIAQRHPRLEPALASAADFVAEVGGGAPWPRPASRRGRLARRLSDPLLRFSSEQTLAEVALIDLLLAPAPGMPAAFKRQLFSRGEIKPAAAGRERGAIAGHAARVSLRCSVAPLLRAVQPTAIARLDSLATG